MNLSEKIKQNFASFLAAFSVQPVEDPLLPAEPVEALAEQDNTLNTLFEALCTSYPESFTDVSDYTQLQKAESITAFLESQASKNSALVESIEALQAEIPDLKSELATRNKELDSLQAELETRNQELETLRQQVTARPSIPLNVTDPALSLSTNQEKDETGKQILSQLPKDLKRKLKKQS